MPTSQPEAPLELYANLQEKALIMNRLLERRPLEQQCLLDAITSPETFPQKDGREGSGLAEYKLRTLAGQQLPRLEDHYPATRDSLAMERALYDMSDESRLMTQHYAAALEALGQDEIMDCLALNRQYESVFGQIGKTSIAERLKTLGLRQDTQPGDTNLLAAALTDTEAAYAPNARPEQLSQRVRDKLLPTLARTAERWLERAGEVMADAGEFTRNELSQAASKLNSWASGMTGSRVKTFASYAAIAAVSIVVGVASPDVAHAEPDQAYEEQARAFYERQKVASWKRGLTPEGSGYFSLSNEPEAMRGAIPYNTINAEWLRAALEKSNMVEQVERMDKIVGSQRYVDHQDFLDILNVSSYGEYHEATRFINYQDARQLNYFMETHSFSTAEAGEAVFPSSSQAPEANNKASQPAVVIRTAQGPGMG
ncbi:hypothetical protein VRRI112168_02335 [Vreelandella rituensis]|uniref:Uncharacterized protein n=1 Tax=Vreelandella rituensis TaxID=2282306 RepID=A0A368UAG4_9GAMM|nr:hypothetical protein [Halomonas rituensis]RCV93586.1 hypothetical protein DU506_00075 [Halomonas rituensis]